MNSRVLILIGTSLVGLAGLNGRVFAGSPGMPTPAIRAEQKAATVKQLEEARTEAAQDRLRPGERGPLLVHDMEKESRLDSLIQRLRNGEHVTPDEIDRARE
jgi:hypothetical protein